MKLRELLNLLRQPDRPNYFLQAPDELGLQILLPRALAGDTAAEDLHVLDAETITKDRAREVEQEARSAPRGGSKRQTFFLHSLQKLPTESVGPLLKAVEDARWSRFIFQAQAVPRKLLTLRSRSVLIKLPFLTKDVVLANLKGMNHDAKTADEQNLYDGTLAGTLRNLRMKDSLAAIKRELNKGPRGIAALFYRDEATDSGLLTSNALRPAIDPHLTTTQAAFLHESQGQEPSRDRRKIVLYLLAEQIQTEAS